MIFDINKNVYRNLDLHYWFGDNQVSNGRNEKKAPVYYDFAIDWGDGTKLEYYTNRGTKSNGKLPVSRCKHTYKEKGVYRINIYGEMDALQGQSSIGNNKNSLSVIRCLKGVFIPKGHLSPLKYAPASFFACESLVYLGKNVFNNLVSEDTYEKDIITGDLIHRPCCKSVSHLFDGCKIKKIPDSLLKNCTTIIDASYMFEACDIESIPEDLFKSCPNLKYVEHAFHRCDYLSSIPENLFQNNRDLVDIDCCFQACKNLTSIPENIFDSCCDKEITVNEKGEEIVTKINRHLTVMKHAVAAEHAVSGYERTQHINYIPPLWEWDWSSTINKNDFSYNGYAYGCTEASNYSIAAEKGWT